MNKDADVSEILKCVFVVCVCEDVEHVQKQNIVYIADSFPTGGHTWFKKKLNVVLLVNSICIKLGQKYCRHYLCLSIVSPLLLPTDS